MSKFWNYRNSLFFGKSSNLHNAKKDQMPVLQEKKLFFATVGNPLSLSLSINAIKRSSGKKEIWKGTALSATVEQPNCQWVSYWITWLCLLWKPTNYYQQIQTNKMVIYVANFIGFGFCCFEEFCKNKISAEPQEIVNK